MTYLTVTRATDARTMARTDNNHARRLAEAQGRSDAEIPYPVEKKCLHCGETKPASDFHKQRRNRDGLRVECRLCTSRENSQRRDKKGRKFRSPQGFLQKMGISTTPTVEEALTGPIMRIPLGKDWFAIIDAADWPLVSGYNWHRSGMGYAYRRVTSQGRTTNIFMHQVIFGPSELGEVDHIDRDPLNNRRGNLRSATRSQQLANTRNRSNKKSSRYRGVYLSPRGKWMARIYVHGRDRYLGVFSDEKDAADAYDRAAIEAFGEFASLNKAA